MRLNPLRRTRETNEPDNVIPISARPNTLRGAVKTVVQTALAETGVPASLHSMLMLQISRRSDAELAEMVRQIKHVADFLATYLPE